MTERSGLLHYWLQKDCKRVSKFDVGQASGAKKAEAGDFSGAIKMWNRALDYSPGRSALHEMKAQVGSHENPKSHPTFK